MAFSAFLFDLDGTLIDSIELILACYRHTARKHLGAVPPERLWLDGVGTPLRSQLAGLVDEPETIEAMVATYREYHRAHHDELVKTYPGVRDAVRAIKRRGARLGIVTSKMRWSTARGLEICGLGGLFEAFVTAEDVAKHKPEPEPVLRALELLGATADVTVFIGDSPHDMTSGRAAGVQTAAVLWGPFDQAALAPCQPDFWVERPEELVQL